MNGRSNRSSKYVSAGGFRVDKGDGNRQSSVVESEIDYKNVSLLRDFLTQGGRILSRRATKLSAKLQRKMRAQVKLAQFLALLPYCDRHEK